MRLHNVRGVAARVGDGVVDAGRLRHVLAQKLHADVHQLDRVQRGAAQLRAAGGVGGDAGELILGLDAGVAGAGGDLVDAARMPGQRGVQLLPDAVAGHEGLGRAALLAGAAVEDDGAGMAVLQIFFDGEGSRQRARAQHIVAAAVAVAAGDKLPALGSARLLGEAAEGVELGEDADDRLAGAIACLEGGLDAGDRRLDGEAFLFQNLAVEFCGLELHQRELGVFPNFVGDPGEGPGLLVDDLEIFLFIGQGEHPFYKNFFSIPMRGERSVSPRPRGEAGPSAGAFGPC